MSESKINPINKSQMSISFYLSSIQSESPKIELEVDTWGGKETGISKENPWLKHRREPKNDSTAVPHITQVYLGFWIGNQNQNLQDALFTILTNLFKAWNGEGEDWVRGSWASLHPCITPKHNRAWSQARFRNFRCVSRNHILITTKYPSIHELGSWGGLLIIIISYCCCNVLFNSVGVTTILEPK